MPPDFWDTELEPPESGRTAPDAALEAVSAEASGEPTAPQQSQHQQPQRPPQARALEGELERDPRFVLLSQLFPGRVSTWEPTETPTDPAGGAADAPDEPETVDLSEGLDADDTEDERDL